MYSIMSRKDLVTQNLKVKTIGLIFTNINILLCSNIRWLRFGVLPLMLINLSLSTDDGDKLKFTRIVVD